MTNPAVITHNDIAFSYGNNQVGHFPFNTIAAGKKTFLPQPPWNITQLINTLWAILTMPKVTESTKLASNYIYMATIHHWMSI